MDSVEVALSDLETGGAKATEETNAGTDTLRAGVGA
jgi:hypothetical protein